MTNEQRQVLLGTIIGDGCLFKCDAGRNYRMNLAHSRKQKEYFLMKYDILKSIDFLRLENFTERTWTDKRTGNEYSEVRLQTKVSQQLTELYPVWYKNKKKIIPENEIFQLDELGLAVKYYDDGCYLSGRGCCISMCDYDDESLRNFRIFLLKKFDISTSVHKGNLLYIPKREVPKLQKIVQRYATPDVLYKLGELLET